MTTVYFFLNQEGLISALNAHLWTTVGARSISLVRIPHPSPNMSSTAQETA